MNPYKEHNRYYTINPRGDGFGAQYLAILSGIAYCNYKNYIYVHTPFIKMEHNTNIKKANEFIGINTNSNFNYTNCNIIEIHVADEVNYS